MVMQEGSHTNVHIKKIKDPFCFYGSIAAGHQREKFAVLKQEINNYFCNEQLMKPVLSYPEAGKQCIVRANTNTWERAVIESLMIAPRSYQVKCFLVDRIDTMMVHSNRVLFSPSWVWELPPQGIKFALFGVQPLKLKTDYAKDQVDRSIAATWSTAAVEYFEHMIKQYEGVCFVDVIDISESIHYVKLYVKEKRSNDVVCVNDKLVEQKFALFKLPEENETKTSQSHLTDNSPSRLLEIRSSREKVIEETRKTFEKTLDSYKSIIADCMNNNKDTEARLSCSSPESIITNDLPEISEEPNSSRKVKKPSFVPPRQYARLSNGYQDVQNEYATVKSPNPPPVQRSIPNNDLSALRIPKLSSKIEMQGQFKDEAESKRTGDSYDKLAIQTRSNRVLPSVSLQFQTSKPQNFNIPPPLASSNGKRSTFDYERPSPLTAPNEIQSRSTKSFGDFYEHPPSLASPNEDSTKSFGEVDGLPPPLASPNEDSLNSPIQSIRSERPPFKQPEKKIKKEKRIEESFFSSTMTLIKSHQASNVILVKGVDPPPPISLFNDAPFPSFMISTMQAMKFRGPYCIQGCAWSAILARRSIVGLGPAGGGKTLAYVAPIVSMLLSNERQVNKSGLTKVQATYLQAQSPPVVVLCSTGRSVKIVADYFEMFLKHPSLDRSHEHRVVGIIGGPDAEKANSLSLLSGCSVLVCSPFTFLRLYHAKQLPLPRLEQLVLDDFHILVEEFTPQIRQVMQAWWDTLNDPDRPNIPNFKPQLLCFGIQWTPGVESFMETCMNRPLLFISDPLEASVYGQVEHRVELLKDHFVFEHLTALLKSNEDERTGSIAVFVRTVERMNQVSSALEKLGYPTLQAHSNMPDYELQMLQQSCDEVSTSPVLLICDNVLSMIDLDTVEIAIHYDFPANAHVLGMRLSLMRNFYKIKKIDEASSVNPRSFLIITEKDFESCLWLEKFLSRLPKPVPPLFRLVSKKAVECKEESKTRNPLCPYLKAYGRCRDVKVCPYRHWLSARLDRPNSNSNYAQIPTAGHVRVYISCVKNATHYYGRLIKHKTSDKGTPTTYPDVYKDLCDKLNTFYSENGQRLPSHPALGRLYAYKLWGQYYRVQVLDTPNKANNVKKVCWVTPGGVTKTRVRLVDTGSVTVLNIQELMVLDRQFESIPFQAIEIRSCCTRPIDQDTEWLFAANKLVHDLIFEKTVEGHIQHAANHTMWLQPVLVRSKLPKSGVYVTECDVVNELLQSNLAEKAPNHLDIFRKNGKGNKASQPIPSSSGVGQKLDDLTASTSLIKLDSSGLSEAAPPQTRPAAEKVIKSLESNHKASDRDCKAMGDGPGPQIPKTASDLMLASAIKSQNLRQRQIFHQESASGDRSRRDSKSQDFSLDELPPLSTVPLKRGKKWPLSYPKNTGAITSGYASETYLETDTTDSEFYSERRERFRQKSKATPPKRHRKPHSSKTPPAHPCRTEDYDYMTTDHEVESTDLSNDSSSTLLSDDSTIPETGEDASLTPTRYTLTSNSIRRSSNESTPTNRHPPEDSRRRTPLAKRSPKFSPLRSSSKTPPMPQLMSSINQSSSEFSSMPPLLSANERSSPVSMKSDSVLRKSSISPKPVVSKPKTASEPATATCLSDTEELPPKKDMHREDYVIYPYYVQLVYNDNISLRLRICENIYVQALDNYMTLSSRDLKSLNKALLQSRNNRETVLLLSTMFSLANSFVPIEEFINLPNLIKRFCIENPLNTADVPSKIMPLTMIVLENIVEKYPAQVCDLTNALVTFLDSLSIELTANEGMTPIVEKILKLLERISDTARQSFISGDQDRLVGILSRLPKSNKIDDLRASLYNSISCYDEDSSARELNSACASLKSSKKSKKCEKKVKSIPPAKKVYDPFNYDRFNNIDTDSDCSSYRPYTPIPVRFDTETETSVTETDTDTDFLPGM